MSAEIDALLTLLHDDDRSVLRAVRDRLLVIGEDALEDLRRVEASDDAKARVRVRPVRARIERAAIFRQLTALAERENPDIEKGALLLASTHTPELDHARVRQKLDAIADTLREAVTHATGGPERLKAFLRGIHETIGLVGAQADFYNYDNNFLHTVLERKRGIPISLILVYMLVGRRLGLVFRAVGTPQRALAWFRDGGYSTFIDAFEGGRLMTRDECIAFLKRQNITSSNYDQLLNLLNDRGILERMTQNLVNYSEALGRHEVAEDYRRLAHALIENRARDRAAVAQRDPQSES